LAAAPTTADAEQAESDRLWILGVVTVGLASAASLAASIALIVEANKLSDEAAEERAIVPKAESLPPGVAPCDVEPLYCISADHKLKWRDQNSNIAPFLLTVGGVGLVATTTIAILMAKRDNAVDESAIELVPTVSPNSAGFQLGMRF